MRSRHPRRVNRDPLRTVTRADLRSHASLFASFKTHYWDLTLDCGHVTERSIRYLPPPDGERVRRGWAALRHPPSLSRIGDPPKRARCEQCAREAVAP